MSLTNRVTLFLVNLTLVALIGGAPCYAAVVCQSSSGELNVKKRCKKGEAVFNGQSLSTALRTTENKALSGPAGLVGAQGVQGPQGGIGPVGNRGIQGAVGIAGKKGIKGQIDFSGCRRIQNFQSNLLNPALPELSIPLYCNGATEFLFQDGYKATPFAGSQGTKIFMEGRIPDYQVIAGDSRVIGIDVYFYRTVSAGVGLFQVSVEGLCCPR